MTQAPVSYLIGIDGGGSRCRFALSALDGRILARHEEGAANVWTDYPAALGRLKDGLSVLAAKAGVSSEAFGRAACFLGLAGANVEGVAARLREALPFALCGVDDDRMTAVVGALGADDGALVSAGTGSFVCRQAAGQVRSLGGWGFHLGDDASGAWLGQALCRRAVLAHDGIIAHSDLTRAVLGEAGGIQGLVSFSLTAAPRDYAALAPRAAAAAEAGDPVATALMRAGANYVTGALATLGYVAGTPLCLLGGLGGSYRRWLPHDHAEAVIPPKAPAVHGALQLAARMAGLSALRFEEV